MEENVILQVILSNDSGIEIRVGGSDKLPPLLLVGILEQVKMRILNDADGLGQEELLNSNQSYEA